MTVKDLRVLEPREKVGLVLVITGDGKGKTTAAMGIALRAAGYHMKVCIIQFMKGDIYSGEMDGVKRLAPEVELHIAGRGYYGIGGSVRHRDEHRESAQLGIALAKEKMVTGDFDVIILDEINNALNLELLDLPQVLDLLDSRPPLVHLVLTGRDAHQEVVDRAHTVTEMREIKHAYREGIEPQKGIDY
jgi:cob(I)alamin adenosyltransferase